MWTLDEITGVIINESLMIHKKLGPGLLESVYESVLERALQRRQLVVERQKPVRIEYEGIVFEEGFRADLIVEEQVVLEIKSVEKINAIHCKQLLTYLRLLNLSVGLLLNFGAPTLKEGTKRIVNQLHPSQSPTLRINRSHLRDE